MPAAGPVLAILCSDIHLSSKAPIARSTEPCWYEAMERQLSQLRKLQQRHKCPVICAGDVFDKWNSNPELINYALENLPEIYAVPGQHDLPNHNMDEIDRSAYWTLVKAGKIHNVNGRLGIDNLILYGFGWEQELSRTLKEDRKDKRKKLAVVHRYCWQNQHNCYEGAPQKNHSASILKALRGYDAVVFGDNHKSWYWNEEDFGVMNCGSFFRRRIDEKTHRPIVGFLHHNGITPHYLECEEDKFIDVDEGLELVEQMLDMSGLVQELSALGDAGLNFAQAVFRYLEKHSIPKNIQKIIRQAMK